MPGSAVRNSRTLDTENWLGISLLVLSLICIEFASIAEVALATVPRFTRTPSEDDAQEKDSLAWVAERRTLLPVTLITLKTAGILFAGSIAGWLFYRARGLDWESLAIIAGLCLAVLVFLQIIPASLAATNPERALRMVNFPLRVLDLLLRPLTMVYGKLGAVAITFIPKRYPLERNEAEEEVQALVEEIGEWGESLEAQEREMIRRIIGLDSTVVREIMVPRPDIIAAEADSPLSSGVDLIIQHGVSRIPIFEETVDDIVGVVYAKDLLRALHQPNAPTTLRALARRPHFVPESKKIDDLLKEFRENHIHMAIAVDEYGGTAGLVSLEDLLEEIVGDIEDEYDRTELPIQRVSDDEAVLDARVSIADLNEIFGTKIGQEDFSTVGGLVYAQLGKIPTVGDEIHVNGLSISVVSTTGRRIRKVRALHRKEAVEDHA